MSRWKKAGLRQGPALGAHRVLSGYSVEPKAGSDTPSCVQLNSSPYRSLRLTFALTFACFRGTIADCFLTLTELDSASGYKRFL
ncbi:hypothetical protein KOW79_015189 [Hemibagrus wyckioides]|uniref:Uncharacterized protein n=1 Tax=Hemibagrus wyckioides TaxID=337641 RepID=A0A9D3NFR1_9TELE|nr:hypothetical protein KOW79_015189 [Hemibagrus wyckioides]